MTETTAIAASPRQVIGKANRRLASEGLIPAVLYGAGREATPISIDRHDFELMMHHHGGSTTLVTLKLDGEDEPVNAVIKEVQHSAVKGTILHVDFLAIRMDRVIQAPVSFHFIGESPGVKSGGVLLHDLREVMVEALPKDLPDSIEVDVSDLEIGDTLHVSDLTPPTGVTIVGESTSIVCSVTTPTIEVVEEVVEEVEGEVELVGEEEAAAEAESAEEA